MIKICDLDNTSNGWLVGL